MRYLLLLSIVVLVDVSTLSTVSSLADLGYGCREGNLPDEIRVDCYPEPGANEEGCRARGCVWCDTERGIQGIPVCYKRNQTYMTDMAGPSCDVGYVIPSSRVECEPDLPSYVREMGCRYRGCTWCPTPPGSGVPSCFKSAGVDDDFGYVMVGEPVSTPAGVRVLLAKGIGNGTGQFEGEFPQLTLDAEFQSDYRLRIRITPTDTPRYSVPLEINPASGGNANPLYDIRFTPSTEGSFGFKVVRKASNVTIFETPAPQLGSGGRLKFANQFTSLSWVLPTENVYGIGENEQRSFRHDFSERLKYPLYATGHNTHFTQPLYGTQPQYTVIELDGNVHAVAIINSNAQEFQMIPSRTIKYITIGGELDMYFFLGPKPDDVVRHYSAAVGHAQLPPYWGLGFHLCKYGYNTLEEMQRVVNRTEGAGIPHDVQWGDIDIMDRGLDFTVNPDTFGGLSQYVVELKAKGIKFVTILDPIISTVEGEEYRPWSLGQELDVWTKKGDGSPVAGRMWPNGPVYFPDYSKPETKLWWGILIQEFHSWLKFDGLWIDMNEPANFVDGDLDEGCAVNGINYPPYVPGGGGNLFRGTLCMDHVDSVGQHYNTHSLYGWFESEATFEAVRAATGKRSMVLSRSTYLGSGKWASHWLGDNYSKWSNLHYSIIGTMQFNLWGMPFVGPDICGHNIDAAPELCQRWMELGAFYPFSRNHNGYPERPQDPAWFGEEIAASSKIALEVRYTLLPYLYTLFYSHATSGSAVFRPLWYNYAQDSQTYGIDEQFMWGEGILISPVLTQGATHVLAYFPQSRYYSYYTGEEVAIRGATVNLTAPMDFIHVHVAGGNVIPTQGPGRNTEIARENPFGLIVALDENGAAQGSLFYDDGDSIDTHLGGDYFYAEYIYERGELTSTVVNNGWQEMGSKIVGNVRVLGYFGRVTSVTVNGEVHQTFNQDGATVDIYDLNLTANLGFQIVFG